MNCIACVRNQIPPDGECPALPLLIGTYLLSFLSIFVPCSTCSFSWHYATSVLDVLAIGNTVLDLLALGSICLVCLRGRPAVLCGGITWDVTISIFVHISLNQKRTSLFVTGHFHKTTLSLNNAAPYILFFLIFSAGGPSAPVTAGQGSSSQGYDSSIPLSRTLRPRRKEEIPRRIHTVTIR
ncbi:hypothetical protein QBC38DRAFT_107372 [Podospora fimiseda]|uniref:Uncharacterized protein n=1 Tax=Podospora fimiseda TaxID=252190 RepID=A0AAN7BFB1_9PEZI|nr:hypothetical protein QBC38DRAFT_107372 [Podospora fimiseda]